MRAIRILAVLLMSAIFGAGLLAGSLAPASYDRQFRDQPDAACSHRHWLGTDELGRDRMARLLYGTRISLVLAPAAALVSTAIAALTGALAGFAGGWVEGCVMSATDLFLSLPWMFLLIAVRAALPLNVSPTVSVVITFALLGCLGWAGAARIVCADARTLRQSDFVLLARASGMSRPRLLMRQILPNLKPAVFAQFLISIPVFILSEANLSILGLGVAEPLPSWGSLLRELEDFSALSAQPAKFVPLILLVITVSCFQVLVQGEEAPV